jgi:iron complex transport system permease protein
VSEDREGSGIGAGRLVARALGGLVLVLAIASLAIGPAQIAPWTAAQALVWDIGNATVIVREIRLPRTLLALSIGFTLGLTGAALQGLLRNPLADATVFGAPQAAALGAVLAAGALSLALPAAAIAGALVSIALVVAVAGLGGGTIVLVLAGLAIGSLAGAATALAISLSPNPWAVTEIVFWLMGSLEDRSMIHVGLATPFLALAAILLLATGRGLSALTLGEETAQSLGIGVARLRIAIVAAAALAAGAATAVAGAIGFVGLVSPHLVRPLVGYDPGRTLLPAGLAGAAILVAADIGVRLIPSAAEVKIGVVTTLLGVPFFLWIVSRRKSDLADAPA